MDWPSIKQAIEENKDELTKEQYEQFSEFADEQIRVIAENEDFFGEGEENQPEYDNQPEEEPITLDELVSSIETLEQQRETQLKEKLKGLTPTQEKAAREAITKIESQLQSAKTKLSETIADLKAVRESILKEKDKQGNLFGEESKPIQAQGLTFTVPQDFSKENIERIITPLKDLVQRRQSELTAIEKKVEPEIEKAIKAAKAQQEMFMPEEPVKDIPEISRFIPTVGQEKIMLDAIGVPVYGKTKKDAAQINVGDIEDIEDSEGFFAFREEIILTGKKIDNTKPFFIAYFGDNNANIYERAVIGQKLSDVIDLVKNWDKEEVMMQTINPKTGLRQSFMLYPFANQYEEKTLIDATTPQQPEQLPDTGKKVEPWEMTREEYAGEDAPIGEIKPEWKDFPIVKKVEEHKRLIQQALSENKTIPENVKSDYPELFDRSA